MNASQRVQQAKASFIANLRRRYGSDYDTSQPGPGPAPDDALLSAYADFIGACVDCYTQSR